jgi:hypothetical protein
MFKHTQYRAKETEQDDLARDKASTLAVLAVQTANLYAQRLVDKLQHLRAASKSGI